MKSLPRAGCQLPRSFAVIIAEKPKAAEKIAAALGRPEKCYISKVPVYVLKVDGSYYVVVSSAGHMFGPDTRVDGLPVTLIRWSPIWAFDKRSHYLRPFYEVLSKVVPRGSFFISACDYDIEGSVICYKIIENMGDLSRAKRMKFSSLTPQEIRESFRKLMPLDVNNAMAGIARSEMDWLWGINVSRLLMRAYESAAGRRLSLSAGRVQTPTLAEAVRRWLAINTYVPVPRFSLSARLSKAGEEFVAAPSGWEPSSREEAEKVAREVKEAGYMRVSGVDSRLERIRPPPPFNLTDLQEEAARIYGMSPYETQEVAEQLYLMALISYPRTNSQRLPPTLDYRAIVEALGRQARFSRLVSKLMAQTGGVLTPRQGEKTDPAHPAIYPTGEAPSRLTRKQEAIYELVVKRFLAAFAAPAEISRARVALRDQQGRAWEAQGQVVHRRGWAEIYDYVSLESAPLPKLAVGERVSVARVGVRTVWPAHGVRLSRLALLQWMEANELGTKGTRARILETLYRRGFLAARGGRTEVTDLGYAVYRALKDVAPELLSVDLTRDFERRLEAISRGETSRDEVVRSATKYVVELINRNLDERMAELGRAISRYLARGKGPGYCVICGRPASGRLCELHESALASLKERLPEVARRLGVSEREALKVLSSKRVTGLWVRDVIEAVLSGTLDWP